MFEDSLEMWLRVAPMFTGISVIYLKSLVQSRASALYVIFCSQANFYMAYKAIWLRRAWAEPQRTQKIIGVLWIFIIVRFGMS